MDAALLSLAQPHPAGFGELQLEGRKAKAKEKEKEKAHAPAGNSLLKVI